SAVQPEAVAARLVAGGDRRVGREAKALLGLGNFLTQLVQVPRRQRAVARLLGRLRGAGQQPFVPAEFQGDVQCPGRGRGRGHVWFSVCKDTGVLPDGDLYHRRYLAAYMVSNDQVQQRGRLERSHATKSRSAGPVCCNGWILIMASSQQVDWCYQQPVPSYSETMMRFYNQQHRFYCGVDLHARTL